MNAKGLKTSASDYSVEKKKAITTDPKFPANVCDTEDQFTTGSDVTSLENGENAIK